MNKRLGYVVYTVVVAQSRSEAAEAPARCSKDIFTILHTCKIDCVTWQVGGDMEGCPRCNVTCNRTLAGMAPKATITSTGVSKFNS